MMNKHTKEQWKTTRYMKGDIWLVILASIWIIALGMSIGGFDKNITLSNPTTGSQK